MSENELAEVVLDNMEARQSMLYNSDAFKAAIFMDPRINYRNSNIISADVRNDAIASFITTVFGTKKTKII